MNKANFLRIVLFIRFFLEISHIRKIRLILRNEPTRLREASKIVLYYIQYFMVYHYFQKIRQFLTDNFIFDKSCYFQLLGKLGYWENIIARS